MNPQAPAPQPPIAPPAPPAPVTPTAPPQTGAPAAPPSLAPDKTSKVGLFVGIGVGVLLLVIAAVAGWFLWFSPAAQAQRVSTAFMKALTAKEMDKVYELTGASDEATKQFLQNAADASEGTFTLKEKAMKDGTGYFLYDLSNSEGKMGRTTVKKQGGKYLVTAYVFGSSNLALIPRESDEDAPSEEEDTGAAADTTEPSCLVASDYDGIYRAVNGANRPSDLLYAPAGTAQYVQNVHFKPDSLDFSEPAALAEQIINAFATFYADNPGKAYKIQLEGSVATTAAADLEFAKQRAEKVASLLKAKGVPASYIEIADPGNIADMGGSTSNDAQARTARSVVLTIVPTTCSESAGSSGSGR